MNKKSLIKLRPRNTLVPFLFKMKSGEHKKPEKSVRRKNKIKFIKQLKDI